MKPTREPPSTARTSPSQTTRKIKAEEGTVHPAHTFETVNRFGCLQLCVVTGWRKQGSRLWFYYKVSRGRKQSSQVE